MTPLSPSNGSGKRLPLFAALVSLTRPHKSRRTVSPIIVPSSPRSVPAIRLSLSSPPSSPFTSVFTPAPPLLPIPTTATAHGHRIHPVLLLTLLFTFSLSATLLFISTLPLPPSLRTIPRSIPALRLLASSLTAYAHSSPNALARVIAILTWTTVFKHAFSIPGAVLLNVLGGALIGPVYGTLLMTFATTMGSLAASAIARMFAGLVQAWFPKPLELVRTALALDQAAVSLSEKGWRDDVDEEKGSVWQRLLVIRLVGVVPWSVLNMAVGVCRVDWVPAFTATFIGVLPWTAVTVQIGDVVKRVTRKSAVAGPSAAQAAEAETIGAILGSRDMILRLVVLSTVCLAPLVVRAVLSRSKRTPRPSPSSGWDSDEEEGLLLEKE